MSARDDIKPLPANGGFFLNFPGVYCKTCGGVYALYSYSAHQPDGIDDHGKPYYTRCFEDKLSPAKVVK